MYFKDRGFKGTPRHDVFRMFSPRFGITKRKVGHHDMDVNHLKHRQMLLEREKASEGCTGQLNPKLHEYWPGAYYH